MKKRKILHLWQATYPWEVRIEKINRSLKDLGYEVAVVARHHGNQPETEVVNGVPIFRVGKGIPRAASLPAPLNPVWRAALNNTIRQYQPDILLLRDIPLATQAFGAAKKFKIPVAIDMAEHYPEAMRSWQKYAENPVLRKLVHDWKLPDKLEAWAVPKAAGVMVVCEEQKARLMRDYGVPAGRIALVLNTPESKQWNDFKKGSSHDEPFCFGYHGILCEDRELETVLQGFSIAAEKNPKITLLIAGGGESEEKLRNLALQLKHGSRIRFTGRFKPEERGTLYNEVDFGIVSLRANIFTEHTLANKFFDYAALGKPFIFTKLKPLETVMQHMNCGLSFTPGNAQSVADTMLKMMQSNYAQLSENGIKAIEKEFHWEKDVERMKTFFEKI